MNGQYTHMEPVDGRPLTGLSREDSAHAAYVAIQVCGRTGTRCFWNVVARKMLFCYGDEPFGGPLYVPFQKYDAAGVNGMVDYINLGKMPRGQKDRIQAANEKAEKDKAAKLGEVFRDEIRPEVLSYATHLDQRRRGTLPVSVVL